MRQGLLLSHNVATKRLNHLLAEDFHHMLTELDVDTGEAETLMQLAGVLAPAVRPLDSLLL
jgi:hypothetical protein